jgi:F-type H+-transporting ATPase subunit epsilon
MKLSPWQQKKPAKKVMKLKISLPFAVFTEQTDVLEVIIETAEGSFGLLEQRLDCVAILVPGILTYRTEHSGEVYVAIDQGLLVKNAENIMVSVRRAYSGVSLEQLRQAVSEEFLKLDEQQKVMRNVMAKLESGFVRRSATLNKNI